MVAISVPSRCVVKCSGLVVACLAVVGEAVAVVFIMTATEIYSLHTPIAVPKSTQPSTLCGMVK